MASNSGYGARNRKLRAHILSHRHKPETVNRKWDEAGDSQSLTPVCTSFNKATPPISPQTGSLTREQVSKRLWDISLSHPHRMSSPITRHLSF